MTTPYLIANPPKVRQFRERGATPSGVIVVHTAENAPDLDGADGSAEAVARFIQGRSDFGSYHLVADRDSIVHLVPFHLRAYGDGTGSNSHAIHVSGATQAARWASLTPSQRRAIAVQMGRAAARAARWLEDHHGVRVPARRITRAQSDARVPGFISHAERDPARRSDPGPEFPWDIFLAAYRDARGLGPTPHWDSIWTSANDVLAKTRPGRGTHKAARLIRRLAARFSTRH